MKSNTRIEMDADLCDLCGTCAGVCPADAIVLSETRILVSDDLCLRCGDCIAVCPLGAAREAE